MWDHFWGQTIFDHFWAQNWPFGGSRVGGRLWRPGYPPVMQQVAVHVWVREVWYFGGNIWVEFNPLWLCLAMFEGWLGQPVVIGELETLRLWPRTPECLPYALDVSLRYYNLDVGF